MTADNKKDAITKVEKLIAKVQNLQKKVKAKNEIELVEEKFHKEQFRVHHEMRMLGWNFQFWSNFVPKSNFLSKIVKLFFV